MFTNFRKGQSVKGRYMNVTFAGTVKSVTKNEWTKNVQMEVDFPAPLMFRGGERSGLFLTNLGEDDFVVVA